MAVNVLTLRVMYGRVYFLPWERFDLKGFGFLRLCVFFVVNGGDCGGCCMNGIFIYGVGERLGLWRLCLSVEVLSTLVFVIRTGGTKILGMLTGGSLGMLAVFTPCIIIKGEGLLFKHSSSL